MHSDGSFFRRHSRQKGLLLLLFLLVFSRHREWHYAYRNGQNANDGSSNIHDGFIFYVKNDTRRAWH